MDITPEAMEKSTMGTTINLISDPVGLVPPSGALNPAPGSG